MLHDMYVYHVHVHAYYHRLLPRLFDNSSLLVLRDCETDIVGIVGTGREDSGAGSGWWDILFSTTDSRAKNHIVHTLLNVRLSYCTEEFNTDEQSSMQSFTYHD